MNDHLWLGYYRLACYMLTTLPNFDTLEGEERRQVIELRKSLIQFVKVTEEKYRLTRTIPTKKERRIERVG